LFEKYGEHYGVTRPARRYRIAYRRNGVLTPSTPLAIDDREEVDLASCYILDCALECEANFVGTFWLEVVRCIVYDLKEETIECHEDLFKFFLDFMLDFNNCYSGMLPDSFYDVESLKQVGRMYKPRDDIHAGLLFAIENVEFAISVVNPEDPELPTMASLQL